MWGMAAFVVAVTATAADTQVIATVYRTVAGLLVALAVLTALTGARTRSCGSRSVRYFWPLLPHFWYWPAFCDG
jgi:hypothetical protein